MVIFVEMPLFTELITGLVDDAAYAEFQKELLQNPKKGNVIPHSGGLRKIRMRLPGRGKSGGARVIYAIVLRATALALLDVYTKSDQADLTPQERKLIAKLIRAIESGFEA